MLDYTNAVASLALLVLMAPVAKTFHHAHHIWQRMAFCAVVVLLGLQVAAPLFDYEFLPEANLLQTLFNLIVLIVVITARREIMELVRSSVGVPIQRKRRITDAPMDVDGGHLAGIRGRGRE